MGGGYRLVNGTSASTPLATGVAGLIKTQRWWLSAAGTIAALTDGARHVPGTSGRISSGRVLNAAGALAAMQGPDSPPTGSGGTTPPPPPSGQGNGGVNTTPPPVTQGAPGPELPNLDARRGRQPAAPKAPASIHANALPVCNADCSGENPPGDTGTTDPDSSTARTRVENRTFF